MTINELAVQVIRVLDLQAEYFRTRDSEKLRACRDAERRLRETCQEIVQGPPALFGE